MRMDSCFRNSIWGVLGDEERFINMGNTALEGWETGVTSTAAIRFSSRFPAAGNVGFAAPYYMLHKFHRR